MPVVDMAVVSKLDAMDLLAYHRAQAKEIKAKIQLKRRRPDGP
jgi:hypothetical protein